MRLLWATDLDGTVVPSLDLPVREHTPQLQTLKDYLKNHFIPVGGVVVSITGRSKAMSEADMLLNDPQNRFPAHYAIYNVGTEIYVRDPQAKSWNLLQSYADYLTEGGFAEQKVRSAFEAATKKHPALDIRLQEEWRNSPYKVSFYANERQSPAEIKATLMPYLGDCDVNVVTSTHHGKTFIDVLPARAGKGSSMQFLANHLQGLGHTFDAAIFSGDSGNDIDAFIPEKFQQETGLPLWGIVPSNAKTELLVHTGALAAQGHRIIHSALPQEEAVLHGLRHFMSLGLSI